MKLVIKVRQDDSGSCTAWCPALPGCSARGESREQALDKLDHAIKGYLASLNVATPATMQQYMAVA